MKRIITVFSVFTVALALVTSCAKQEPLKTKTIENLKTAITGETTASAKYAAFAAKAREEKMDRVAILFEAASKAEGFHAKKETDALEKLGVKMDAITPKFEVKTTKENLQAAIEGESHEITSMYPDFVKIARDGKLDDAATAFDYALQVEKKHLILYKKALAALDSKDSKKELLKLSDTYAVCPVCGNTMEIPVPDVCEICGEGVASFIAVK